VPTRDRTDAGRFDGNGEDAARYRGCEPSGAIFRIPQCSDAYDVRATMMNGGHAENALPQSARANVNCRMLPDDTPENVIATLKSVIADTQVTITRLGMSTQDPSLRCGRT